MATFEKVNYKEEYIVTGQLTDEDIKRINEIDTRTTLTFNNTVGLDSKTISKISNGNIVFSILGGLEPIINNKTAMWNLTKYKNRTYLSPLGLATVLYFFESIEKELNPNWTPMQKVMYVYNILATNIEYVEEFDPEEYIDKGVMPRSLNGLLYHKLTCAGMSLVFKEMMDRLGIKCKFMNKQGSHDFNLIEIDGQIYGIDVTWDNCYKENKRICEFKQCGRDKDFFNNVYHRSGVFMSEEDAKEVDRDTWTKAEADWHSGCVKKYDDEHPVFVPFKQDQVYKIRVMTDEELEENLSVIRPQLEKRPRTGITLSLEDERTRKAFLPYDLIKEIKEEQAKKYQQIKEDRFKTDVQLDYQMITTYEVLKENNQLNPKLNNILQAITKSKKGYVLDLVGDFRIERPRVITKTEEDITKRNEELKNYIHETINDIVNNFDIYLNSHKMFKESEEEYDIFTTIEIWSKFKIVLEHKEELLEYGYRTQELEQIHQTLTEYVKDVSDPDYDQKANDIDFLSAVFEDTQEIKRYMEDIEETSLTEEEFISKFLDVSYIRSIFKLEEFTLTDEELEQVLTSAINKNKAK